MVSFERKYDQITTRLKGVLCDQFSKKLHPAGRASLCSTIVGILPLLYVSIQVRTYLLAYLGSKETIPCFACHLMQLSTMKRFQTIPFLVLKLIPYHLGILSYFVKVVDFKKDFGFNVNRKNNDIIYVLAPKK